MEATRQLRYKKAAANAKTRGRGKHRGNAEDKSIIYAGIERHGVGVALSQEIIPYVKDFDQVSVRVLSITIHSNPRGDTFLSSHSPQSASP